MARNTGIRAGRAFAELSIIVVGVLIALGVEECETVVGTASGGPSRIRRAVGPGNRGRVPPR